MDKLDNIPFYFLEQLSQNEDIYNVFKLLNLQSCSQKVKVQIWQYNTELFEKELIPLLNRFEIEVFPNFIQGCELETVNSISFKKFYF